MNRVCVLIGALIGALAASACEARQKERGVGDVADSAVGDSAYQVRLRTWRRDSTVLDSVTQEVKIARLYALYRQAVGPDGATLRLMTDIGCEQLRLAYLYGAVPSDRAITAMLDTVYRDIGVTDGLRYFAARAPREGRIETGSNCLPLPAPIPDTIGHTRLDIEYPRPRPNPRSTTGR